MSAFQPSHTSTNKTYSSVEVLFRVVNVLKNSAGVLIHNLLSINNLKEEGRVRLCEEAAKSESPNWEPASKSKLRKQINEALDKNAPKDSLYRKIYLAERSLVPVVTFGLICNGRNYGNRKTKSKSKQTLEGGVEEGSKDDDVKSQKHPLEEDVKLWPTFVFKALVKGLKTVEIPKKIGLYCAYKDSIYREGSESNGTGEGESGGEGECEDEQIVLLKALIQKLVEIAFPGNEDDGRDARNPLKRQRAELTQYRELEYAATQASNSGQIPSGLEGLHTRGSQKIVHQQCNPQPQSTAPQQPNPQPQSTAQVQPNPQAKPMAPQQPNPQPQSTAQVQPNPQAKPMAPQEPNPQPQSTAQGAMREESLTVAGLFGSLLKVIQKLPCYVNKISTGLESPIRIDTTNIAIILLRNIANWSSPAMSQEAVFGDLQAYLKPETNVKIYTVQGTSIATTILLDREGLMIGWLLCSVPTIRQALTIQLKM